MLRTETILLTSATAALICASCHPIGPPGDGRPRAMQNPAAPATSATPAAPLSSASPAPPPAGTADVSPAPPPAAQPRTQAPAASPAAPKPAPAPASPGKTEIVTAEKAPGKPGYVLSPHTGKLMLVRGIPSGVVVPDQTCPPGEKKSFRVP